MRKVLRHRQQNDWIMIGFILFLQPPCKRPAYPQAGVEYSTNSPINYEKSINKAATGLAPTGASVAVASKVVSETPTVSSVAPGPEAVVDHEPMEVEIMAEKAGIGGDCGEMEVTRSSPSPPTHIPVSAR